LLLSVALLGACGARGRIGLPPDIFPVATAWVVPLEDAPLGELASDGQRIFVSSRDGLLRALSPETGEVLWQVPKRAGWLAARPGALVLHQRDGLLWRIDPQTGSALWRTASGVEGELPPVLDGANVLVAGQGIAAFGLSDGRAIWGDIGSSEVTAAPVVFDEWVFSGERSGALLCRSRATGAVLWTHETGSPLQAPAVLDDRGRVFLGTTARRFVSLDPGKDGRERWRWRLGADVTSGGTVLGNRVLFASFENVLFALKRSNGHLIWRAPLPSRSLAAPLLIGATVLVACHENEVLAFDGRNGKRLGIARTPTEMRTPPLLLNDTLFVGLRNPWSVAALALSGLRPPALAPPGPEPPRKENPDGKGSRPGRPPEKKP